MSFTLSSLVGFFAAVLAAATAAQSPFPGTLPGLDIGGSLPASFEASGCMWHPRLQQLFVVSDTGKLVRMEASGVVHQTWSPNGDIEDVCVADPATNFVYLVNEQFAAVLEFNFATGQVTRVFDLSPYLPSVTDRGLEALTFVPDPADPEGGLFHAGHQDNGRVYVFRLPVKTSSLSSTVTFVQSYVPVAGRTDLSGLCYDPATERIYVLYDTASRIAALTKTGALVQEWTLPGSNQEGIAIHGCRLFIAQDQATQKLLRYSNFPSVLQCEMLSQDSAQISLTTGGTNTFSLRAPNIVLWNATYVLLGSASGTTPGFDIPPIHVPLNPDWYLETIAGGYNSATFVDTVATFPWSLTASSKLVVPPGLPPALAGTELTHAWIAVNPNLNQVGPVSNTVTVKLVP